MTLYLILLLELDDLRELDNRTLHRVKTLDNDQDVLPGTVSSRLALRDGVAEDRLEICGIVVLEDTDKGARETGTKDKRVVVELIGNDEGALGGETGNGGTVGGITHGDEESGLLAHKLGNELLGLCVQIGRSTLKTGSARRQTIGMNDLLDGIGAGTGRLSKTEIVVGGQVDGFLELSCELEGAAVVLGDTL